MKKLFGYISVLLVAVALAFGAQAGDTNEVQSLYAGNQISALTFGTYNPDGVFGVGVGAELSVSKYFAVQVSTSKDDFDSGSVIENFNIEPVIRYPIGNSGFAPYAIGGIGFQFESNNDTQYLVGGGLEYRFTDHIGTFADYQRVFVDGKAPDFDLVRAGVRWTF